VVDGQTRFANALKIMNKNCGDHVERWVGSGLLVAECQFRKSQRPSPDSAAPVFADHALAKKPIAKGAAAAQSMRVESR
jgi:hypothetical protein